METFPIKIPTKLYEIEMRYFVIESSSRANNNKLPRIQVDTKSRRKLQENAIEIALLRCLFMLHDETLKSRRKFSMEVLQQIRHKKCLKAFLVSQEETISNFRSVE